MTVRELCDLLDNLPDEMEVKVLYEMFAERDVDPGGTGVADGVFWIEALDS